MSELDTDETPTNEYIDARDGNACVVCGNDFRAEDATVPYGERDGWQQHAHVVCP